MNNEYPQDNPEPNPINNTFIFFFKTPPRIASSNAIPTEADDVFAYMAGTTVDFKAKVNGPDKKEGQEARIAGFMADFEEAYDFAKDLGLSDEAIEKIFERI